MSKKKEEQIGGPNIFDILILPIIILLILETMGTK